MICSSRCFARPDAVASVLEIATGFRESQRIMNAAVSAGGTKWARGSGAGRPGLDLSIVLQIVRWTGGMGVRIFLNAPDHSAAGSARTACRPVWFHEARPERAPYFDLKSDFSIHPGSFREVRQFRSVRTPPEAAQGLVLAMKGFFGREEEIRLANRCYPISSIETNGSI